MTAGLIQLYTYSLDVDDRQRQKKSFVFRLATYRETQNTEMCAQFDSLQLRPPVNVASLIVSNGKCWNDFQCF